MHHLYASHRFDDDRGDVARRDIDLEQGVERLERRVKIKQFGCLYDVRKRHLLQRRRLGGQRGWYYANWLWRLRGFIDLLVGGVGLRRGRRDPEDLQVGDALDFWRVESYEPGHLLRLRAEMRLPGQAWLAFCRSPYAHGAITTLDVEDARRLPGLSGVPHEILFSLRCFKQTGALIDPRFKDAAR